MPMDEMKYALPLSVNDLTVEHRLSCLEARAKSNMHRLDEVEKRQEEVEVRVKVENTSDRDGKEVVQLYVGEEDPAVERPVRELKAFQKVLIKAGQSKEVTFTLTEDMFSYYSQQLHSWTANKGAFQVQICKNANEVLLSAPVIR